MHTMVLWGSVDSPRNHLIVSPQVCIVRMTIPHKAILRRFPIRIRLCVLVCVCVIIGHFRSSHDMNGTFAMYEFLVDYSRYA